MGQLPNLHIIGGHEERSWDRVTEDIFEEIMVENFTNVMKTINPHIKSVQKIPSKRNMNATQGTCCEIAYNWGKDKTL